MILVLQSREIGPTCRGYIANPDLSPHVPTVLGYWFRNSKKRNRKITVYWRFSSKESKKMMTNRRSLAEQGYRVLFSTFKMT